MPTLPKEVLSKEQKRRREAYVESRAIQRKRTRFYGQSDGPPSAAQGEALFIDDSQVGRISAMNVSNLPRRRAGSYHQGINYTGVNPIRAEFHQCSRDIERREACENFLADQLISSGVLWAVAQAVLQFSNEEFMYLLTQQQMFQDLWGEAHVERRQRTGKGEGGSVKGTGSDEEMREATAQDLTDEGRQLLQSYKHGWTRLKTVSPVSAGEGVGGGEKAPRFDLLAEQLGFSFFKMRRRVQTLILTTGRMETFLWFQKLYEDGKVTVAKIHKAIAADEAHFEFICTKKLKSKTTRATYNNAVSHHRLVLKELSVRGKERGLKRNEERINELVKQEARLRKEKDALGAKWDAEKEEKEIRGSKARHRKAEIRALGEKGALEIAIEKNFETLKNREKDNLE